jgi:hypothetical protein
MNQVLRKKFRKRSEMMLLALESMKAFRDCEELIFLLGWTLGGRDL